MIDVNLDDLQAAIEAGTRAAATLHSDTMRFDGRFNASLARELVQRVERLQACVRDQHVALQELREGIRRLREALHRSAAAKKPPPIRFSDDEHR